VTRQPVHATAVARHTLQGWRAVLLTGPSGVGKSDLALRLIGMGWRLVGDDYVFVFASGGRLFAAPVSTIEGRMEVRGVGITSRHSAGPVAIALVVDLTRGASERLPEPAYRAFDGLRIPLVTLDPTEPSAGEKVATALAML